MSVPRRASYSEAVAAKSDVPLQVDHHRFISRYQSDQKAEEASRASTGERESKSDSMYPAGAKLDRIEFATFSERSPTGGDTTVVTIGSPVIESSVIEPPPTPIEVAAPPRVEKKHTKQQSISSSVITVATDETAMLTDLIENIRMKDVLPKAAIPEGKNLSSEMPGNTLSFVSSVAGATAGASLPEIRMSSDDLQRSKDYPTLTLRMRTPNRRDLEEAGAETPSGAAGKNDSPSIAGRIAGSKTFKKKTTSQTPTSSKCALIVKIVLAALAVLLIGATVFLSILLSQQKADSTGSSSGTAMFVTSTESSSYVIKSGFADLLNITIPQITVTVDGAVSAAVYNYYLVIQDGDYVPKVQAAVLAGDLTLSATMSISKIKVPAQNLEITVCQVGYAGSDCSACHALFKMTNGKCSLF